MKSIGKKHLQSLSNDARQLRKRWSNSLARVWLSAWQTELLGMLPSALSNRITRKSHALVVGWPLPDHDISAQTGVVVLKADQVMSQRLILPVEAVRNLNQVLRYEIERYTPYSPEEVHFCANLIQKQKAMAEVELIAISMDRLQHLMETAQSKSFRVSAIDVEGSNGVRLGIDLLPAGSSQAPKQASKWDRMLQAGLCAGLLLIPVFAFQQKQNLISAMELEVGDLRLRVTELTHLQKQLVEARQASAFVLTQQRSQSTKSEALSDLTGCLGSDSWIEQLEFRNDTLTFSGQSKKASGILPHLKACTSITQAQFQGVIQSDANTGNERFSINAHLKKNDQNAPTVN